MPTMISRYANVAGLGDTESSADGSPIVRSASNGPDQDVWIVDGL
jgi:hypothetical protein